jgi:hypothetical protein
VSLSPVATALTLLAAHTPVALGGARFLAGVCSGVVFAAGGAWLQELSAGAPPGTGARRAAIAMSAGFGAGPLVASLLPQFAPDPLRLPYLPHLALGVAKNDDAGVRPRAETMTEGRRAGSCACPAPLPAALPPLLVPWRRVFGSGWPWSAAGAGDAGPRASVAFAGITTARGRHRRARPAAGAVAETAAARAGAVGLAVAAGPVLGPSRPSRAPSRSWSSPRCRSAWPGPVPRRRPARTGAGPRPRARRQHRGLPP